jgi:uncharacterized protein (TIGR00297 family)
MAFQLAYLQTVLVIVFLLIAAYFSVRTNKLTTSAGIAGVLLALLIYAGLGLGGIFLLAAFFIMGTMATSWRRHKKATIVHGETHTTKRKGSQVLANGGAAGLISIAALILPNEIVLFQLMLASALSSATADTLSSELGNVYGKKFVNILSFKKDERGLDGVVSLEGTLLGICGSILIAFCFAMVWGWTFKLLWIIVAGTIGNLADSILGASLERKGFIKNDVVNFLNTLFAAIASLMFYYLF